MSDRISALERRAILDLVEDTGGELNDDSIAILINELGYRVARRDVRRHLLWLAEQGLVTLASIGASPDDFLVAGSTPDGRDVATGKLRVDGVSRHKTGG